ncbi:MAG TPA: metallophosphoesterase family protein [Candidatus Aminicenantes bacterium]|nr:metallophosphoesterase family protein [Candidatus Aminicenantes bacterium]
MRKQPLLIAILLPVWAASGALAADRVPRRIVLNWYGDPATTAAVTWRTHAPAADAAAQIQTASPSPLTPAGAFVVKAASMELDTGKGETVWTHSARFSALKSDTLYAYRVGSGEHWSEWNHFRTAADDRRAFRFVFLGDLQNELASQCGRVVRASILQAPDALFMLHAGDLVSRAWRDDKWGEWFTVGEWIFRSIPQLMVPGNHEYRRTPSKKSADLTPLWRPHFTLPENGPPGLEETVYTLDVQGARLVALNPNTAVREQAAWLDRVLRKKRSGGWTVLLMHQPIYSTGRDRDNLELRQQLLPIIDAHGVDLVLQGHDHTYGRTFRLRAGRRVRSTRGGTVYVVSVGGPKQYPLNPLYGSIMARMAADRQLYQVIQVEKDRLRFDAWTVDGVHFDGFELRK